MSIDSIPKVSPSRSLPSQPRFFDELQSGNAITVAKSDSAALQVLFEPLVRRHWRTSRQLASHPRAAEQSHETLRKIYVA